LMRLYDDSSPGTVALALALLAAWGVLLVTRGRVRRLISVVALLLALGVAVTVLLGAEVDECAHRAGWYWAAVASLPLVVGAALAAVFLVPGWPEMGRKYDAPAEAAAEPAKAPEEQENLDLWKAMDEGRDPTA
jgi:cytochrome c-type biogenesis protein CcmH/NrfG